ncbi:ABC transporter ATP-binding protein/permease [Candidatus Parcubacteria bacterium]|nr:ABC transporter ATP-binding protein/permease [Patescibacteria group bacterium]MBU4309906.1 ABC transporter ATP-binding protein/permease [Patescibacteria group bacterium]MBU4432536.1 ABC transporter ATP-binding protein/permease [Patescibacteria group bacterium]MBU4577831.1 ABC transporter ATP-binding protein/permease [Patescibacteria group bacterium]MCG2696892.1 ABC transporter ATP-binding protein/permease [Candidatus Parcubacteria bacterium]
MIDKKNQTSNKKKANIFDLLKPYTWSIGSLVVLAVTSSGLGLVLPKIIAHSIDSYIHHIFVLKTLILQFGLISIAIFVATYLQSIVQTYASERVALDLRRQLTDKISRQSHAFIEGVTQAKLLTNLMTDVDAIKMFVSMAIVSLVSSVIIVIGASILLLTIDWELALAVLVIIPIIAFMFYFIFSRVKLLMKQRSEVIDWLNKVINESILGATLIRVLNSQQPEYEKFVAANAQAQSVGIKILRMFASMMPVITFVGNMAMLIILSLGGHFVITNAMTLGDFTAFNSYIALLIFPVLIIGMMSNAIAQATASYERIAEVLESEEEPRTGTLTTRLRGDVEVKDVVIKHGDKATLKNVSFLAQAGSRTAIIGPTAAGKTLLLYSLIGLVKPDAGMIEYDQRVISDYDAEALHQQIGFVFQDSIIFNLTLRENIAFSDTVKDADLQKALDAAELKDFVDALPQGLDTMVSERGSSLSGGQKQRIMLARALALNPRVLLLDDFTARVDNRTEQKILENIIHNYPDLTLISVTQKISSIEKYDQIILLMEGEVIAAGLHDDLLKNCPEYVQIYNSQQSTE